jgi:hypothetical protein
VHVARQAAVRDVFSALGGAPEALDGKDQGASAAPDVVTRVAAHTGPVNKIAAAPPDDVPPEEPEALEPPPPPEPAALEPPPPEPRVEPSLATARPSLPVARVRPAALVRSRALMRSIGRTWRRVPIRGGARFVLRVAIGLVRTVLVRLVTLVRSVGRALRRVPVRQGARFVLRFAVGLVRAAGRAVRRVPRPAVEPSGVQVRSAVLVARMGRGARFTLRAAGGLGGVGRRVPRLPSHIRAPFPSLPAHDADADAGLTAEQRMRMQEYRLEGDWAGGFDLTRLGPAKGGAVGD